MRSGEGVNQLTSAAFSAAEAAILSVNARLSSKDEGLMGSAEADAEAAGSGAGAGASAGAGVAAGAAAAELAGTVITGVAGGAWEAAAGRAGVDVVDGG